ncbi:helix-turn-helix transcriptional regulator [Arsenophonus nasoniae]|uniref:Helix-turn-helix transcriptional regulator n=1 Tax=Arsenophonus nasoniae TaxID=638 RepID=A0AA95K851_9GAMM|nr:helix-turn-helix transcriptional regulator [Arsenophonus nasoniae]WGM03995.1 helix-turn-helix transcriptional regulator [Arsenophonus nasoniae]
MNSDMIKFFLSSAVPSGFVDSEGELEMNNSMLNLLHSLIYTPEMKTLIERVQSEKSPFCLMCNLSADFKKSPTVWQFHFLPLFGHDKEYLGTFFHAHEFLFLSPLDYVDGMQPYTVTTEKPNKLFTDKEWEVLFLAFQRLSLKEIARRLDIGMRTVGHHLNIIYEKADVHSGCQLRAFGKSKGFDRYIPYNFVSSRRTAFERSA